MPASASSPAAANSGTANPLHRLFDLAGFDFDLAEGVVLNPAKNRDIYMSTDLARGIYEALVEETGTAWKTILHHCGVKIGERLGARLDRDVQAVAQTAVKDLSVAEFQQFIEEYLTANGWGKATVDFTHTAEQGVIEIKLLNSFFAEVLYDVDDYPDALLAGLLEGLVSNLAGQPLGCLEAASPRKGATATRFLISSRERIERLLPLRDQGQTGEQLLASLLRG